MKWRKGILFSIILMNVAAIYSQYDPNCINSIRNIDLTDSNFSDLTFLKAMIGDKRIVMIGELSHTAGTNLKLNNRVIRYLHEEMGFDNIAMEYGMYNIKMGFDLLKAGYSASHVFRWSINMQGHISLANQELFEYIGEEFTSHDILHPYGIDCIYGDLGKLYDKSQLDIWTYPVRLILNKENANVISEEDWHFLMETSRDKKSAGYVELDILRRHNSICSKILAALKKCDNIDPVWTQIIKGDTMLMYGNYMNKKNKIEYMYKKNDGKYIGNTELHKYRDIQMADNLNWLIENLDSNDKLIVSAANYHVAKQIFDKDRGALKLPSANPMGFYINQKYQDELFSIGSIIFSGVEGHKGNTVYSWLEKRLRLAEYPLTKRSIESFEYFLHQKGLQYAYVNFQDDCFQENSEMIGILDYSVATSWHKIFDGVLYMDSTSPDSLLEASNLLLQSDPDCRDKKFEKLKGASRKQRNDVDFIKGTCKLFNYDYKIFTDEEKDKAIEKRWYDKYFVTELYKRLWEDNVMTN